MAPDAVTRLVSRYRLFTNPLSLFLIAIPVLVLLSSWLVLGPLAVPQVEVHFIDVGKPGVVGDSILIRSSDGKVVLIDGGYPDSGALDYLQSHSVTHINLLLLTHAHEDHSGGLAAVLRAIPVDKVVTNGLPLEDSAIYAEFEQAVRESGAEVATVKTGDKLRVGKLTFRVLSPKRINPDIGHNNNSIVMRLDVGQVSFLLTGDLQRLEEERLLAAGTPLQADILKVAHHGADSSSSPAFVEKIAPSVAIISSGKGNMHALPHQVTVDNLLAFGITVYSTIENGTVIVNTDGKTYTVTTERGGPVTHWSPP